MKTEALEMLDELDARVRASRDMLGRDLVIGLRAVAAELHHLSRSLEGEMKGSAWTVAEPGILLGPTVALTRMTRELGELRQAALTGLWVLRKRNEL